MTDDEQQRIGLIRTLFNLPESRTKFTKTQFAYADVRRAIVAHELPAATPLDESLLISMFPVGRTPLREALKRLNFEGFLNWPAHQAPSIRDVAVQELQHLYETRRLIEPTVAVLAARRASPEDHTRMKHYCEELTKASLAGNIYQSVEMDYALHVVLARSTQNRFLAESSDILNLQSLRLWYRSQVTHGISKIHIMHDELVDTIIKGDEQKAEELALTHIASSLNRQRSMLGEFSSLVSK